MGRVLKIRLQRVGRVHEPTFRLVVTDSRNSTKSGRFLDVLGSYDPRKKVPPTINAEKASRWLKGGAKPTGTVHNIFIDAKILSGKKVNVLPKKTVKKEEPKEEAKSEQKAEEVKNAEEKAPTADSKLEPKEKEAEEATKA